MNEYHEAQIIGHCAMRYGAFWRLLSEHERKTVVRAIFGGMPLLANALIEGTLAGSAWIEADKFVGALVTAPRMTGFAADVN